MIEDKLSLLLSLPLSVTELQSYLFSEGEDGAASTPTPAKIVTKPVIDLDLSSPQDPQSNSPMTLKQVRYQITSGR